MKLLTEPKFSYETVTLKVPVPDDRPMWERLSCKREGPEYIEEEILGRAIFDNVTIYDPERELVLGIKISNVRIDNYVFLGLLPLRREAYAVECAVDAFNDDNNPSVVVKQIGCVKES